MNKILLCAGMFLFGSPAIAQNFVEGTKGPLKFKDVVNQYEQHNPTSSEHEEKGASQKNSSAKVNTLYEAGEKDYHFDRWKWYWQQHLDPNGYLVSPVKTWNEWQKMEQGRKAERTTSTSMAAWTFEGPDSSGANGSGVGRVTTVAFHPTDPNTYWVATPGGGAWKTTNNGASWTCMTDGLPLLSISDIKFNTQNPNTVYLCTGDKDGDDFFSIGVLKSYNGGVTWNTTGLTWGITSMNLANSLLVNPSDSNTLLLGTTLGIYISHDGGASWTLTPSSGGYNFKQLLYHPTDTNIVYATSHYDATTSTAAQIYRSTDGGTTWAQVTSFTDGYRISLAVTPANPSIVKAVVAASDGSNQYGLAGVYNSTNTGASFSQIYAGGCSGSNNLLTFNADGSGCGGQGYYDLTIAISPTNANIVYLGGVNGWSSTDGGSSWSVMDQWSIELTGIITIHADKHFMGFEPLVPGRFFECNDGGIYWSDDPSSTGIWNDVTNGLGITQFYRVAVSNLATYEMGGAQDVGTKIVQFGSYQDFTGGDGMECQLDPLDSYTVYSSSENGTIFASVDGIFSTISMAIPGAPTGGWITPFVLEPSCNDCILAGYQQVYLSPDQGNTWSSISPDLTAANLLRVVTSLSDPNTIYAADNGSANIFYTHNMGATWTTITAPYSGAIISDIKVDQFDATKVWVTFSGYGSPQVVSYSPSSGWTSFNTGLPDVPVNCILIDTFNRVKYVGAETGVFYRDTTMSSWQPFTTGMPVVRVNDLQINYATDEIWAATFGRSLWKSPRQIFGNIALGTLPLAPGYLTINPNPSHGDLTVTLGSAIPNKNVALRLINENGTTVWQDNVPVNNGNTLQANIGNIPRGNYILEVDDDNKAVCRKKMTLY